MQQVADIRLVLTAMLENVADGLKDQHARRDEAARVVVRTHSALSDVALSPRCVPEAKRPAGGRP